MTAPQIPDRFWRLLARCLRYLGAVDEMKRENAALRKKIASLEQDVGNLQQRVADLARDRGLGTAPTIGYPPIPIIPPNALPKGPRRWVDPDRPVRRCGIWQSDSTRTGTGPKIRSVAGPGQGWLGWPR